MDDIDDREWLMERTSPILETTVLGYAVGSVALMVRDALTVARELPEGVHEPAKLRDLRAKALAPRISRSVLQGGWFGAVAGLAHLGAELLAERRGARDPVNFAASGALVSAIAGFAAYPGHRLTSGLMGAAFGASAMYPYGVLQDSLAQLRRKEEEAAAIEAAAREKEPERTDTGASTSVGDEGVEVRELKPWEQPVEGREKTGFKVFGMEDMGGLSLGAWAVLILYGVSRYMKFKKNRLGIEKR